MFNVPFFPNVSMGWDPSPRCDQRDTLDNSGYPFTHTIGNNTPANFRTALEMTKKRLLANPERPAHPQHQLLERMDRGKPPGTG